LGRSAERVLKRETGRIACPKPNRTVVIFYVGFAAPICIFGEVLQLEG
jgi:hypothetical protein